MLRNLYLNPPPIARQNDNFFFRFLNTGKKLINLIEYLLPLIIMDMSLPERFMFELLIKNNFQVQKYTAPNIS